MRYLVGIFLSVAHVAFASHWDEVCKANLLTRAAQDADETIRLLRAKEFDHTLERLIAPFVAIPSISEPEHQSDLDHAADVFAQHLRALKFEKVAIEHRRFEKLKVPVVTGRSTPIPGKMNVLVYGHLDVQTADPRGWKSPPFELTRRGGRYYARGGADNKAPLMMNLGILRAFQQTQKQFPVNIQFLVEGGEEVGYSLAAHLKANKAKYRDIDAVFICDGTNVLTDRGAIELSSRGYLSFSVKVETGADTLHSGRFGGGVLSATPALVKILNAIQNPDQTLAIPGLNELLVQLPDSLKWKRTASEIRTLVGLLPEVQFVGGARDPFARIVRGPSVSYDLTSKSDRSTISGVATADLSFRLGPGMDPKQAGDLIEKFLNEQSKGLGVRVTVTRSTFSVPYEHIDPRHAFFKVAQHGMKLAYGKPAVFTEDGGTLPLISELRHALGDVPIFMYGASDEQSNWHGINESFDRRMLLRTAIATTYVLQALGSVTRDP